MRQRCKRPLAIASPRDQGAQKAMELVLNGIYKPATLNTSHVFPPCRTPHGALEKIDQQLEGAIWFIETDTTQCFDSVKRTFTRLSPDAPGACPEAGLVRGRPVLLLVDALVSSSAPQVLVCAPAECGSP